MSEKIEKKDDAKEELEKEKAKVKEDKENELMGKYDELNEKYVRLAADFDNYKKRVLKEKSEISEYAVAGFTEKLLPVFDNFERALDMENADKENEEGFFDGMKMIYDEMMGILKEEGIEIIDAVGEEFDPNEHYGVAVEDVADKKEDEVLEIFQNGYTYKGKVIRPSMVKVNKKS